MNASYNAVAIATALQAASYIIIIRVIKQYKRVLKFCYLDWSRLPLLQTLPKEGSQFCDDSAVWSNLAPTLVAGSLDFLSCSTMKTSLFEPRHGKTNNVAVRPAKTQISLGICQIWSESLLCTQWVAKDPSFLHAVSEDSDQTGWMPRWSEYSLRALSDHSHFVGFVMRRHIYNILCKK